MVAEYTNIFYLPLQRIITTSVISCDTCNGITIPFDRDCHLNRKFAYHNDASEACTKAHRTEIQCSTYREKFDGAAYWKFTSLFFFQQFPLLCRSLFAELKPSLAALRPNGVIVTFQGSTRNRECIYKRCRLSSRVAYFLKQLEFSPRPLSRKCDKFGYWVEKSSGFQK